jgi:hypothetical protein
MPELCPEHLYGVNMTRKRPGLLANMSLNSVLEAAGKQVMEKPKEDMKVLGKLNRVLDVMMELQTRELEAEKEVIEILAGKK